MALPIAPTPTLNTKESKRFMRLIEKGLKEPSYPIPAPRLERARKMILERMRDGTKKDTHGTRKSQPGASAVPDDCWRALHGSTDGQTG